MALLQGGGQNLPSPCVCYPKDPMWNRVKTGSKYLFQAFRQITSRVFSSSKQLRKDYYAKKLKETKKDMRKTWKILKSAMNQPTKANPIEKLLFNDEKLTE